ncbi:MAG: SpoIIE family protein phosphatase [Chloroflexi bacterium]|nr:SpoIIE family protein phosphatase [Chloroflexota bacterium]
MAVTTRLLRRFPFFERVPDGEMKRLAQSATRHTLPANCLVIRQGDPGDAFYMIVSGAVEIVDASEERRLNLLGAGQWFGDYALLDDQPRSASVRTRTRTVLISLPKAQFLWLVTTFPVALHILATGIQQQLRERDREYLAEVETRARQLEQVYYTALDITRHLDRDKALKAIRERAIELLQAAGGDIYLYDSQSDMLVPQASAPDAPKYRVGVGCAGRAYASGKPRIERPTRRTQRHELAAPIQLSDPHGKERQLGALRVYRAGDGDAYQKSDCTLLELFASQAAIVIENADLVSMRVAQGQLDKELQDARRVQQQLIPAEPPHLRGYQIAALWHPAKQVSGDYYDFISLSEARIGLVIADVSGKGLDAALFMANARATLRASAGAGGCPAEIVARANNTLAHDSTGIFVTAFFGILDPNTGVFSYVNAGHNPPLLYRAQSQTLEVLKTGNLALAIVTGMAYQAHDLCLEPGDLLVLYTDGVTEATNAEDALFDLERLHAALYAAADGTAQQVIQEIDARVRTFTGAYPQSDDITVVALRRT